MFSPRANDTIRRRVFVNFRVVANATLSCPAARQNPTGWRRRNGNGRNERQRSFSLAGVLADSIAQRAICRAVDFRVPPRRGTTNFEEILQDRLRLVLEDVVEDHDAVYYITSPYGPPGRNTKACRAASRVPRPVSRPRRSARSFASPPATPPIHPSGHAARQDTKTPSASRNFTKTRLLIKSKP